jgi:hypothetical protein
MVIILWLILSILVGAYANSKGRSGIGYFILSMILTPVLGLIIAIIVEPDIDKLVEKAISTGKRRKCPYCAELVKNEAKICKHCGKEIAKLIQFRPRKKN